MEKEERKQEEVLRKKAYEKPRIVHQQPIEIVAGECTKTEGDPCYPEASQQS